MLDNKEFSIKYNTTLPQKHEESFLENVSDEDKQTYEECEILTGKNKNGNFNKFNKFGKANQGKRNNTTRTRAQAVWRRIIDEKISNGELYEIYDKILSESRKGNYRHSKEVLDRTLGKEQENIHLEVDNIDFVMDESKLINKKKKKKE